jgi:hypothetical protein
MEFDFYLELASRAEDSRMLDLLRFPSAAALQGGGQWAARWWAHGKTKRMHSGDREKIFKELGVAGFNELELKWRAVEPAPIETLKIVRAQLDFFPSPMNELWAPVPLHQLKSHAEDLSRRNFRNVESVFKREYKLPHPSVLECYLRLAATGSKLSDVELQEASIAWIRSVMPPGLAVQEIFGYGCVHGSCRRMSMVMSVGFPEIDELGVKFENIYPILIGPRESCEGLAVALRGLGTVVPFSNDGKIAILSIPPDQVKAALENTEAKAWIVPRQPSPHKQPPKVIVVPPQKSNKP